MEKYIKVNAEVAKFLHLDTIRNAVKDGGYLLWMMDIQSFGKMTDLPQILTQIGGILLTGEEAREEQDGVVNRNLPTPTDKRFIPDYKESSSDTNQDDGSEDEDAVDTSDKDETDLKQEGGGDE